MNNIPIFNFTKIWQRHVELYTEIFIISLNRLCIENCIDDQEYEDKINYYLWEILREVCLESSSKNNQEIPPPTYQQPIPDSKRVAIYGSRTLKKPDFTCDKNNNIEPRWVSLHIECKKLGKPRKLSWKFNERYILDGILRFDSKEHQYGADSFSGIMIGYIVSMLPEDILKEVNMILNKSSIGCTKLKFNFKSNPVFKTNQKINRQNVKPKNFELIHLWANLVKEK